MLSLRRVKHRDETIPCVLLDGIYSTRIYEYIKKMCLQIEKKILGVKNIYFFYFK